MESGTGATNDGDLRDVSPVDTFNQTYPARRPYSIELTDLRTANSSPRLADTLRLAESGIQDEQSVDMQYGSHQSDHSDGGLDCGPQQTSPSIQSDGRLASDRGGWPKSKPGKRTTCLKQLRRWWKRLGPWRWNAIALIFASGLFVAAIVVMAVNDGKSLTDWQLGISLNTIISILSTVAMFSLMSPLGDAIGQCKWLLFRHKEKPLSWFQHLDSASRGPYGSLKLFANGKPYGKLPALGAALTIMSVAVNPFMQQLIHTEFRNVINATASIPIALDYGATGVGGFFTANLTMKAAGYSGFVSSLDTSFNVSSGCPTGNCTWPAFQTLGVCSSCTNITDMIERVSIAPEYFGGGCPCNFSLPNGHTLDYGPLTGEQSQSVSYYMNLTTTAELYSEANDTVDDFTFNNLSLAYLDKGSLIIDFFTLRAITASSPSATECMLQYCIKTIEASSQNGELVERETKTWTNDSEDARKFYLNYLQSDPSSPEPEYYLTPPDQDKTFVVNHAPQQQLTAWLNDALNKVVPRLPPDGQRSYPNDQIQGIDAGFDHGEEGLSAVMDNVARSMTAAMRTSSSNSTQGLAYQREAYIHIRWAWIALPAVVYVLAVVFVASVALKGRTGDRHTEVWKSSVVAALLHGLSPEVRQGLGPLTTQEQIDDVAEDLKVGLLLGETGWVLGNGQIGQTRSWNP